MSVVSGPKRVEGRLVALLQLPVHVLLIRCIGTWPGPSIMTWQVVLPGDLRQLAERLQFGELGRVVGVGDRARPQPVAERERHVVAAMMSQISSKWV